jgi:hypothetical protein
LAAAVVNPRRGRLLIDFFFPLKHRAIQNDRRDSAPERPVPAARVGDVPWIDVRVDRVEVSSRSHLAHVIEYRSTAFVAMRRPDQSLFVSLLGVGETSRSSGAMGHCFTWRSPANSSRSFATWAAVRPVLDALAGYAGSGFFKSLLIFIPAQGS